MKLYPFQKIGRDALKKNHRFLLADEMGLGKTPQALTALTESDLPVLVICPASVRQVWADEAATWQPLLSTQVITSGKQEPTGADLTIISYDLFGQVKTRRPKLVICDEAHYLQSRNARRTARVLAAVGNAKTLGSLRVWLLTGTPIWSRPRSLFPLLVLCGLWPGDYWTYAEHHCGATVENGFDDRGARNLEALRERLTPCLLRRLKTEVLTELPAKQRQVVKLAAGLSEAEKELGPFDPVNIKSSGLPVGPIATAVRLTALKKLTPAAEHIRMVLDLEDKVVVFAWNTEVIEELYETLRADHYGPVVLEGSTSASNRASAVERFQTDPSCRVFIGQTIAAGVGLTLTAARTVIFVQPDWTPANLLQAEDRVHRIGQDYPVLVQYLVTPGSIEETMLASVLRKVRIAERIIPANQGEKT